MSLPQEARPTASVAVQVDFTSEIISRLQSQLLTLRSERGRGRSESMDSVIVFSRRSQGLTVEQQPPVFVPSAVLTEFNARSTLRVIPLKRMQSSPSPLKRTVEPRLRSRHRGARRNEDISKKLEKAYSGLLENKNRRSPVPKLIQADSSSRITPTRLEMRGQQQVDWGFSELNDPQNREWSPEQLLNSSEIDVKEAYTRTLRTAEQLRDQLGLGEAWLVVPPCSRKGLSYLLSACKRLFRLRSLTVDVLELIHQRERLVLNMMKLGPQAICRTYKKAVVAGAKVLQAVNKWKESELPHRQFIYLGHDIESKIETDDRRLNKIYQQSLAQLANSQNLYKTH